jgi:hypothetical protein
LLENYFRESRVINKAMFYLIKIIKFELTRYLMSTKEIKENLKNSIDGLSAADIKVAVNDLNLYFEYLQARREMPRNKKLSY